MGILSMLLLLLNAYILYMPLFFMLLEEFL